MIECEPSVEAGIRWELPRRDLWFLKTLLQSGVGIRGKTGTNVRDFLLETLGIGKRYVETDLQTVFVDSHPVDDLDATPVPNGCTLALSGAMPGLAGATMRRGGTLARMRDGITASGDVGSGSVSGEGVVCLKLFNQPLSDLVELLAARPLGIPRRAFSDPRLRELAPAEVLANAGEFIWLKVHLVE